MLQKIKSSACWNKFGPKKIILKYEKKKGANKIHLSRLKIHNEF